MRDMTKQQIVNFAGDHMIMIFLMMVPHLSIYQMNDK